MAATRRKAVKRTTVMAELKLATMWSNTAVADVRRSDRSDALDSIQFAQKALRRAETRLVESSILEGR